MTKKEQEEEEEEKEDIMYRNKYFTHKLIGKIQGRSHKLFLRKS